MQWNALQARHANAGSRTIGTATWDECVKKTGKGMTVARKRKGVADYVHHSSKYLINMPICTGTHINGNIDRLSRSRSHVREAR